MGCGGMGYYECFCGGDLCVCANYGEIPCYGCDDCEEPDEDFDEQEPTEDHCHPPGMHPADPAHPEHHDWRDLGEGFSKCRNCGKVVE